jgi:hypothetical protein
MNTFLKEKAIYVDQLKEFDYNEAYMIGYSEDAAKAGYIPSYIDWYEEDAKWKKELLEDDKIKVLPIRTSSLLNDYVDKNDELEFYKNLSCFDYIKVLYNCGLHLYRINRIKEGYTLTLLQDGDRIKTYEIIPETEPVNERDLFTFLLMRLWGYDKVLQNRRLDLLTSDEIERSKGNMYYTFVEDYHAPCLSYFRKDILDNHPIFNNIFRAMTNWCDHQKYGGKTADELKDIAHKYFEYFDSIGLYYKRGHKLDFKMPISPQKNLAE